MLLILTLVVVIIMCLNLLLWVWTPQIRSLRDRVTGRRENDRWAFLSLRQRQRESLTTWTDTGATWTQVPHGPGPQPLWPSRSVSPSETDRGLTTTEPIAATGKWTLTSGGRMAGWSSPRILTMPASQSKTSSPTGGTSPEGGSPGPAPGSSVSTHDEGNG